MRKRIYYGVIICIVGVLMILLAPDLGIRYVGFKVTQSGGMMDGTMYNIMLQGSILGIQIVGAIIASLSGVFIIKNIDDKSKT